MKRSMIAHTNREIHELRCKQVELLHHQSPTQKNKLHNLPSHLALALIFSPIHIQPRKSIFFHFYVDWYFIWLRLNYLLWINLGFIFASFIVIVLGLHCMHNSRSNSIYKGLLGSQGRMVQICKSLILLKLILKYFDHH